jgi:hypothetical protein
MWQIDYPDAQIRDVLFAAVNVARQAGVHPSTSLRQATEKFCRRFRALEALAAQRGVELGRADLAVLDGLWDAVKGAPQPALPGLRLPTAGDMLGRSARIREARMRLGKLAALAAFAVTAGCTHNVNVALAPDYGTGIIANNALAAVRPPQQFRRGQFADRRADTTRLASFKQGVHTYNMRAERRPQDALYDGVRALLVQSGHTWSDTGMAGVRVDLQLLSVEASRNAGLVRVGANSRIQIKLDFVSPDGRVLHTDIYNGTDDRSQALIGLMGLVRASIDASLVNCLNAVGSDTRLAAALGGQR